MRNPAQAPPPAGRPRPRVGVGSPEVTFLSLRPAPVWPARGGSLPPRPVWAPGLACSPQPGALAPGGPGRSPVDGITTARGAPGCSLPAPGSRSSTGNPQQLSLCRRGAQGSVTSLRAQASPGVWLLPPTRVPGVAGKACSPRCSPDSSKCLIPSGAPGRNVQTPPHGNRQGLFIPRSRLDRAPALAFGSDCRRREGAPAGFSSRPRARGLFLRSHGVVRGRARGASVHPVMHV